MIWQAAYAELVFLDEPWPDVDRRHLWRAVETYARRDRRYGGAVDAVGATREPGRRAQRRRRRCRRALQGRREPTAKPDDRAPSAARGPRTGAHAGVGPLRARYQRTAARISGSSLRSRPMARL